MNKLENVAVGTLEVLVAVGAGLLVTNYGDDFYNLMTTPPARNIITYFTQNAIGLGIPAAVGSIGLLTAYDGTRRVIN